MNCPKCTAPMARLTFSRFAFDRCTGCQGLFLDPYTLESLRHIRDSEVIDGGDASCGGQFNHLDHITCPACGGPMLRMVDPHQSHIWYEQCKSCGGSFFDAGEFRDLKHHTVFDLFKDLATPERK